MQVGEPQRIGEPRVSIVPRRSVAAPRGRFLDVNRTRSVGLYDELSVNSRYYGVLYHRGLDSLRPFVIRRQVAVARRRKIRMVVTTTILDNEFPVRPADFAKHGRRDELRKSKRRIVRIYPVIRIFHDRRIIVGTFHPRDDTGTHSRQVGEIRLATSVPGVTRRKTQQSRKETAPELDIHLEFGVYKA